MGMHVLSPITFQNRETFSISKEVVFGVMIVYNIPLTWWWESHVYGIHSHMRGDLVYNYYIRDIVTGKSCKVYLSLYCI